MTVVRRSWTSPAKINLHLEVLGRRPDGFHELVTVFQTVSLADRIDLEIDDQTSGIELRVEGPAAAGVPGDRSNLVVRAVAGFLGRAGIEAGVRLKLAKRIPAGGGLGGGSGNAATVLRALQRVWPGAVSFDACLELAAELGSDVPYFLVGGTALGLGRGERVFPLPELPARAVWLLQPAIHASTPEVFRECPRAAAAASSVVARAFASPDPWSCLWREGRNDLEPPAFRLYPELGEVAENARRAGATAVRLSGSGASLVALADASFRERFEPPSGIRVGLARTRLWSRTRLRREDPRG